MLQAWGNLALVNLDPSSQGTKNGASNSSGAENHFRLGCGWILPSQKRTVVRSIWVGGVARGKVKSAPKGSKKAWPGPAGGGRHGLTFTSEYTVLGRQERGGGVTPRKKKLVTRNLRIQSYKGKITKMTLPTTRPTSRYIVTAAGCGVCGY